MSHPGRNDPCPCGSGRTYKRCCQPADVAAGHDALSGARRLAAEVGTWEVEAVPLPVVIEQAGSERPVVVLVVADGGPIHQNISGRLGGGVRDVAQAIAKGVSEAAEKVGIWPDTVQVRQADVRAELAPLLAARGVEVEHRRPLPGIMDVALSLMEFMGGTPVWPPVGRSETWLGWGLPRERVAEIFEAAAGFWDHAPWRVLENMQAPRCVLPSGRAWTAMVLGNGGQEFGLILHSEHADAFERPGLDDPSLGFEGVRGRMLSLIFEPLSELSGPARKEIATRRWTVADVRAGPDLMTVNTPGGGVSEEDAQDLVALLRAVPLPRRGRHVPGRGGGRSGRWRDVGRGARRVPEDGRGGTAGAGGRRQGRGCRLRNVQWPGRRADE